MLHFHLRPSCALAYVCSAVLLLGGIGCGSDSEPLTAQNSQFQVDDGQPQNEPPVQLQPAQQPAQTPSTAAPTAPRQGSPSNPQQPPPVAAAQLNNYEVPNGTAEELLDFIAQLNQRRAQGQTTEEMSADLQNINRTISKAADRILGMETDAETRTKGVDAKLGALRTLAELGAPEAIDQIRVFCQQLRQEKDPKLATLGRVILFSIQVGEVSNGQDDNYQGLIDEVKRLLAETKGEQSVFVVTQQAAVALWRLGRPEDAAAVYRMIGEAFREDENLAAESRELLEMATIVEVGLEEKQEAVLREEPDSMTPYLEALKRLLAEKNPGREVYRRVEQAARYMEILHHDPEAKQIYQLLEEAYKAHPDEELAELSVQAAGNGLKRLSLIGQPFRVEGTKLDGTPFKWEDYAGKIVLVDFWATWCGPCLREIPNIQRNYEGYRKKGFEVVGVNLDDDPMSVQRFLAGRQLPWPTVVSSDPEATGFSNPLAVASGVDSIPFIVLVNREGNVEALHVRGEDLGKRLEALLGPPDAAADLGNPTPQQSSAVEPALPLQFVALLDDEAAAEGDAAEDDANPYLAPADLSPVELVDFVLDMEEKPKSIRRRAGFADAIVDAADRVLAAETSDKYQTIAAEAKFNVLHELASFGDEKADKRLMQFVDAMKGDTRERIARQVKFFQLERRAIDVDDLELAAVPALLAELKEYLTAQKLVERHLRIASCTVHAINRLEDDDQREKYFAEFGELFAGSRDKMLSSYGEKLAKGSGGSHADLVGKQIELTGTTDLDAEFNWDTYRGKVVLVDFWATWCAPCRRELPQVRALYDKWKEQGFDVVAISLDEDLDALAAYLEENKIPWTNLLGDEARAIAKKYGVKGIPTMLLVDRDGKVVAAEHQVAKLAERAKKLIQKKPAA